MSRRSRSALAVMIGVATVATLAGCSAFFGPPRDADGRVTETTTIRSTTLLEGDCFSFVDGTDLAEVDVTPCAQPHTYIVIGQGELTDAQISADGGLQNAVSASCAEDFAAFKEAAAEGVRPEQEFIVSTTERDGESITLYLCVATDS